MLQMKQTHDRPLKHTTESQELILFCVISQANTNLLMIFLIEPVQHKCIWHFLNVIYMK